MKKLAFGFVLSAAVALCAASAWAAGTLPAGYTEVEYIEGNGTDARRRHRRNNRLGIHALKIVNRNPRLVGFSFVTSLLVYVQGLRV